MIRAMIGAALVFAIVSMAVAQHNSAPINFYSDHAHPIPRSAIYMLPGVENELHITQSQRALFDSAWLEFVDSLKSVDPAEIYWMKPLDQELQWFLSPSQSERLEELFLQVNDGIALFDDEDPVVKRIVDGATPLGNRLGCCTVTSMMIVVDALLCLQAVTIEAVQNARSEFSGELKKVLTNDELLRFEEMKGKPFQFSGNKPPLLGDQRLKATISPLSWPRASEDSTLAHRS